MGKLGIIVIPGGIQATGKIPFFVKTRLDLAYKIHQSNPGSFLILSGKWTFLLDKDPIKTEAQAAFDYLSKLDIDKNKIIFEKHSQDLISCAYFTKIHVVKPGRFKKIIIVTSDFQKERVEYVFRKIYSLDIDLEFKYIQSQLDADSLWDFFIYEKNSYLKTKVFLRKMKTGHEEYLTHRLFTSSFYKSQDIGRTRLAVYDGKIGRPQSIKTHFSLKKINQIKKKIFKRYKLSDTANHKTLNADFWSGRFLNFSASDHENNRYSLKFVLNIKDKSSFIKEVKLTKKLKKEGLDFIPGIIGENTRKAPFWYLYRVLKGKDSGKFSINFSFDERFYAFTKPQEIISHLQRIRTANTKSLKLNYLGPLKMLSILEKTYAKNKKRPEYEPVFIKKAFNLLVQNVNKLKGRQKYLAHSDLHPANIIYSGKKKKVYLIDFEHASLNNIAFDFSFIYLFSWNNKAYQDKIFSSFLHSLKKEEVEDFNRVFDHTFCFFLFWLLDFVSHWKKRADILKYQEAKKYIFAMLKEYIIKYK